MDDNIFFQSILSEIDSSGEESIVKALKQLNLHNNIRKVSIFGKNVDIIYIDSQNSFLLVKFDFIDTRRLPVDWLADEDDFNNEGPLYFSDCSHRPSPVHQMQRAKAFFSRLHPYSDFHLLLVCNYNVINYEDIVDTWDDAGVRVVHNVQATDFQDFCPYVENSQTESDEDTDIDSSKIDNDEFDKLLDEFIESQIEEKHGTEKDKDSENDEEEEKEDDENEKRFWDFDEEDKKMKDGEESMPYTFSHLSIKLFRETATAEEAYGQSSLKAFNIRNLSAVSLHLEGIYSKERVRYKKMEANLYNEMGQLLHHKLVNANFSPNVDETIVSLSHTFEPHEDFIWEKGNYVIEIKYKGNLVIAATLHVGNKDVKGTFLPSETNPHENPDHPIEALNRMVGLTKVKEQMEQYRNIASLSSQRKKSGLPTNTPPLHAVFMGNSGTGKTTVARLYGAMLHELGLLSRGHVVFRERSSLTGPNYSNEEHKTLEAIEEAQGGVLFIDEAYTLYRPHDPKDPGQNIIETLLTAMSDENKRDWALLLAGYTKGMSGLLSMNQGLSSRIPEQNRYCFEDYSVDELIQIADVYCQTNNYLLTPEARDALRLKVNHDYLLRDENFGNARYINTLFTSEILQAMAQRVARLKSPKLFDMLTIRKEDIPALHLKDYNTSLKKLHDMVGLGELKKSIEAHLNMVKLNMLRNEQGIETTLPPLHMVFTGNPGTGKTTVASFIGEIYASLGLLSKGDVIYVERKDLVGEHVGETEKNTAEILKRAKGNVLFIDEAYTLTPKGLEKDYGHQAIEVLLSTLSKENIDMLVIMAGYPEDMKEMLESNRGLKSRVPHTFHFVDYNADELMQIADSVVKKTKFSFSPAARRKLKELIDFKLSTKDAHWGNARFITRLISTQILPAMSNRLATLPLSKQKDKKCLSQICKEDIPSIHEEAMLKRQEGFDEAAIRRALKKLDALVGLEQVKQNIHNFVQVARYKQAQGNTYSDNEPLRWNFTGNTGTGKSTVAAIMAELLKAMNLIEKGHVVEIKAEEMCNVSDFKADEILLKAMKRSSQGLLFVDGDAPMFKHPESRFSSESLRFKLSSMTMELPGMYALIIAEHEGPSHVLTSNLREGGISSFDHTLYFADYTEEELLSILAACLRRKHLALSEEASAHMTRYIHSLSANRQLGYANARTMSKLAHAIAENYILRISKVKDKENTGKNQILFPDVEHFVWKEIAKRQIGFL